MVIIGLTFLKCYPLSTRFEVMLKAGLILSGDFFLRRSYRIRTLVGDAVQLVWGCSVQRVQRYSQATHKSIICFHASQRPSASRWINNSTSGLHVQPRVSSPISVPAPVSSHTINSCLEDVFLQRAEFQPERTDARNRVTFDRSEPFHSKSLPGMVGEMILWDHSFWDLEPGYKSDQVTSVTW